VSQVKIYVDEDAMDSDLVAALCARGVTVITAQDAGLTEKPDEEQLAFAPARKCVLYTSSGHEILFNLRLFSKSL
jgi:predicted nuclease of predicted toxin-antitoxin system